jgi:hypothetical protein
VRSKRFETLLNGGKVDGFKVRGGAAQRRVDVTACHPLVVLLLLQYIYTDDVASIWDARVARVLQSKYVDLKIPIGDVKADLKRISESLGFAPLSHVLNSAGKMPVTQRTLPKDVQAFFSQTSSSPSPLACDTTLLFAEKEIHCSSVLLRARCPFFEAMFSDRDWTVARKEGGNVVVNMQHLRWRPMQLVFKFLHEGVEDDLFDYLREWLVQFVGYADCSRSRNTG